MNAPYITVQEQQPVPVGNEPSPSALSSAEAEYLSYVDELRPGFCERGYQSIRLAQYCGILNLGHRILEILPKVGDHSSPAESRGLLLRLLRLSDDIPVFRHLPVGQRVAQAPLLEAFITAFFDSVATIARGGLLRNYQACEDDLSVVRGRIVVDRQVVRLASGGPRVACRFDELTPDNVWNRVLKRAIVAVRPMLVSAELRRRWIELAAVFDEVANVEYGSRALGRLVFDRHAERYRTAIEWARWILASASPALRAGEQRAPGLLFDMNVLFESAVTQTLRRTAVRSGIEVCVQDAERSLATVASLPGGRAFRLRPDVVLRRGGNVLAVADVKWKRVSAAPSGYLMPDPGDVYQMQAYATAFGCRRLALVYPWYDALERARETTFFLPGQGSDPTSLVVVCLDLESETLAVKRGERGSGIGCLLAGRQPVNT